MLTVIRAFQASSASRSLACNQQVSSFNFLDWLKIIRVYFCAKISLLTSADSEREKRKMANMATNGPIITQNNDVVIVQLPFDFETLFTQPLIQQHQQSSAGSGVIRSTGGGESGGGRTTDDSQHTLRPRYRRNTKTKKSIHQHLEEIASPHLRLSQNGRDIYCAPCDTDLTEYSKVKKSSIKLHLSCKRHLFNLKMEERKALIVPTEIKFDEQSGLYQCTLCGKAISNDIHDVRRHCAGKRHVRLLDNQGTFEDIPAMPVESAAEEAGIMSAREYNNDFVYDVLDFLMRTNCQMSAIGHMKRLLNKWTIMKLPSANAIRRNHLPKYLERNPDIAKKREQVAARKVAKMRERLGEPTGLEEIIGEDLMEEGLDNGLDNGATVTTMTELEQAIHAFADQDQLFTVTEYASVMQAAVQAAAMHDEDHMNHEQVQ